MRTVAFVLLVASTGLWLGGLVAIFLFAPAVFQAFDNDRVTAGVATSAMFVTFARYQLAVAAGALLGAFASYALARRGAYVAAFALLGIASIGAAVNKLWLVPRMEALRQADAVRLPGEGPSEAFRQLHGYSMILYVTITALVFLALVSSALPPCRAAAADEAPRA